MTYAKKKLSLHFKVLIIISIVFLSACVQQSKKTKSDSSHKGATLQEDSRKKLGREFLQFAMKEFEFVIEPEVVSLVSKVGKELVKASGSDPEYYNFFVVKNAQINAFAVPGGYIFIHDGLLKNIDTIEALAGVLAHEVAHIERNHMYKNSKKSGLIDLATIAAIFAGGLSGNSDVARVSIAQAANISLKLEMSRENEEDADIFAIKYLRNSKYNPTGLVDLLSILAYYERFHMADMIPPYLSTHPGVGERLVMTEALLKKKATQWDADDKARREWRRITTILAAYNKEKNNLGFKESSKKRDKLDEEETHYLKGLYALKSGKLEEAQREYQKAIKLNPDSVVYHADLSTTYLKQQKIEEAEKEALAAIRLSEYIASPYITLAMAAKSRNNFKKAIKYFKKAEKLSPKDPYIHYQMGDCYNELKMVVEMRFHLALFYRYEFKPENALTQLYMALEESKDKWVSKIINREIYSIRRNGI